MHEKHHWNLTQTNDFKSQLFFDLTKRNCIDLKSVEEIMYFFEKAYNY